MLNTKWVPFRPETAHLLYLVGAVGALWFLEHCIGLFREIVQGLIGPCGSTKAAPHEYLGLLHLHWTQYGNASLLS